MPEAAHEVRNSLIDGTRSFQLNDDGLSWRDGERPENLRYADIASIHLISYPGYGGKHLQCTLRDRAGNKLKIRSHHYVSLGRFEDRSQSYGAFIRELAARLGSQGHDVGLHYGSRLMAAVWMVLFWLSVIVLIGYFFAVFGGVELSWGVIAPITVLVVMLPVSWSMIGQSWDGNFEPNAPPPNFLGDM